jgi:phage shock protein PspC (stress-responsive transcriptional regulator)
MIQRNEDRGIVAGVASGLADSYDLPTWMVRTLFIVGFLLAGIGLVAYLWLWSRSEPISGQMILN